MVAHDPQQRSEIARKAAAARHSIDTAVRQITDRADELTSEHIDAVVAAGVAAFKHATPEQVDRLRGLFAPLVKAVRTGPGGS